MKSKKYLCIILAAMLLTASFVFAIPASANHFTDRYYYEAGVVDVEARVTMNSAGEFSYNYTGMYMSQNNTLFDLHWQGVVTRQSHTDIESYISAYTYTPVSGRYSEWNYSNPYNDDYGIVVAVNVYEMN